ncbi:hypothetical protein NO995_07205 [Aestuariibaculum sp. M13]|uniref:hypothetical protein n=1 Tax=Aestuariibaculum sp. M13 TaxID=2967132 RepID=UPI002159F915|nr:hypothetical protein [Aestuariibaculum sp. M13]MCR8667461.1 hypothetical protein [Aestuariibaculum sp. M13]
MKRIVYKIYFILMICSILLSCKNKVEGINPNKIEFNNKVYSYLKKDLNANVDKNQMFIILTTYSCSGCTKTAVNYLKKSIKKQNKISLIAVGDTKKETLNLVETLGDRYQIYYDFKGITFDKLNLHSNAVIEIQNKKDLIFYTFGVNENIELMLTTIDKYLDEN